MYLWAEKLDRKWRTSQLKAYWLCALGRIYSIKDEWRLCNNIRFVVHLRESLLYDMKDIFANIIIFFTSGRKASIEYEGCLSPKSYFLCASGRRTSIENEGRLSLNQTLCAHLGIRRNGATSAGRTHHDLPPSQWPSKCYLKYAPGA